MIYSMTAFASHQTEFAQGSLTVELKSVNNRFLDLHFRIPDEMRSFEAPLRELLSQSLQRGKVELRISFYKNKSEQDFALNVDLLAALNLQFQQARQILNEVSPPNLTELLSLAQNKSYNKQEDFNEVWQEQCLKTTQLALADFIQARANEGQRLANTMLRYAEQIHEILVQVRQLLPRMHAAYREKLNKKLRETLENAAPNGFNLISGEELSARIASEAALFSMRVDVAEELDRLDSHQKELATLLYSENNSRTKNRQSLGKRLDFLFQEMNREINTLGSKSVDIQASQAVINLKLLVEQLREQAQNIE